MKTCLFHRRAHGFARVRGLASAGLFSCAFAGAPAAAEAPKVPAREETLQLSPFEVRADSDTSYGALNSTSLTRFNIELKQMPISADIFTEAFMKDTASSTVEDIISTYSAGAGYSTAVDPGALAGTLQPGDRNGTSYTQMRGFNAPTMQRDGLLLVGSFGNPGSTGVGMTSNFDTERVEVINGPQALLFSNGGAGGVINVVSKQARLGQRPSGSASFKVDQYGGKRLTFDYGFGNDKVAARIALLKEDVKGRRLHIGGPLQGSYVQLAWRPIASTTVRLSGEMTRYDRIVNGNMELTAAATDPRNGVSLHYLLATGRAGATNPDTGAPYPGGALMSGGLNWGNVDSLYGRWRGELTINSFAQLSAETRWNSWLSTQVAAGYNNYDNDRVATNVAFHAPNSPGNPLGAWAIGFGGTTTVFDTVQKGNNGAFRFSALATNQLFGGRARSQTNVGGDYMRSISSNVVHAYFEADSNFNVLRAPGSTIGATRYGGRTLLPAQFEAATPNPAFNRLSWGPRTPQITVDGKNYVYQIQNEVDASLITPQRPLGTRTDSGNHSNTARYNKGAFAVNTTDWLDGRLTTLAGVRLATVYSQGRNQSDQNAISSLDTFNYNVGANYALREWLRVYASYSDSDLPPLVAATDAYGAPSGYGHGTGKEVGFKIANPTNSLSGSIAYYRSDATNEQIQIPATLVGQINPAGLNGRAGGLASNTAYDGQTRSSEGIQIALTAAPSKNWRMRLSVADTNGKIRSGSAYNQLYNDQFHANNQGQVTYRDGTAVLVPVVPNATQPTGGAGAVPLTLAIINDPANAYWANPASLTGLINTGSAVARVLRVIDPVRGPILTGVTGLPISAIQINPLSRAANLPPPGSIVVARPGDATIGYPQYNANLTSVYTFATGWLKGFRLGGTISASWNQRGYYYYAGGVTPTGAGRTLLKYPDARRFDLITGYTRKFERFTWSSQLNVTNVFNRYDVMILPNSTAGFNATDADAGFYGQPRVYAWTNSFTF